MKVSSIIFIFSLSVLAYGIDEGVHQIEGEIIINNNVPFIIVNTGTNSEEKMHVVNGDEFNLKKHHGLKYKMDIESKKNCSEKCPVKLLKLVESVNFLPD